MTIPIFILFLWIILILVVTFVFKKDPTNSLDYTLAGRKVGFWGLTSTLVMTEINPTTLLGFSSLAIPFGLSAFWFPAVFLAGLLFYTLAVSKKWAQLPEGMTAVDFFTQRYGYHTTKPLTIVFAAVLMMFCATYLKATALIFGLAFGWSFWTTLFIVCFTVLMFTFFGGYRAVVQSDSLCFALTLIIFPLAYFLMPDMSISTEALSFSSALSGPPPLYAISLILLCVFSYILSPWYAHRMFSAKSPTVAFGAMGLTSILVFGIYALGIGLVLKGLPLAKEASISDEALPFLFFRHPFSPILKGLFVSFFFSLTLSTLSSLWNTTAILISKGLTSKKQKGLSVSRLRWLTLGIALWTAYSSHAFVDHVLPKLILTNVPLIALSFALLGGLYWKGANAVGLWVSFIVGCVWGFGCYFYYGEAGLYTWHWAIKGIPLIFISGIIGSLLRPQVAVRKYR